jgi:hypothetical protein
MKGPHCLKLYNFVPGKRFEKFLLNLLLLTNCSSHPLFSINIIVIFWFIGMSIFGLDLLYSCIKTGQ